MTDGSLGRGRSLAAPQFPGDDGHAHPWVRELLARAAAGDVEPVRLARSLRSSRLLAPVVAVLDGLDAAGGDKDSHMAVVSMVNEAGRRGLLAFSSTDALASWDPQARPVPAWGRDLARAALDDGAEAVVIDVAGPAPVVLEGVALAALADTLDLVSVEPLIHAALAPLTSDGWAQVEVLDGRTLDAGVDVVVLVEAVAGAHPDGRLLQDLARQAARTLAARSDIAARVPGGLGVSAG